MDLKRLYPQIPVIITENGVGNYDEVVDGQIHDQYRIAYLEGYVDWLNVLWKTVYRPRLFCMVHHGCLQLDQRIQEAIRTRIH